MLRLSLLILLSLLVSTSDLSADILYSVTDLGTLGGCCSGGTAINNLGQVVGSSYTSTGQQHAFLYTEGQMQDLGTLGGSSSVANAINNLGQVVGSASTSSGADHAFLYSNGQMQDLGTLGGSSSVANGINNLGQVVGSASTSSGADHAFLYSNEQMTDLGTFGYSSHANEINDAGQITGGSTNSFFNSGHAFLYTSGQMTDLGTLSAGAAFTRSDFSGGASINNAGQITGVSSSRTGPEHAFLYSNGVMTQLGDPRTASVGLAVNDLGQVTGWFFTSLGTYAFVYSAGEMMDLNTLIDPAAAITLMEATAINDDGQIVANSGLSTSGRSGRAYLLTPNASAVPEPSTIALFGLALVGLAGWTSRR